MVAHEGEHRRVERGDGQAEHHGAGPHEERPARPTDDRRSTAMAPRLTAATRACAPGPTRVATPTATNRPARNAPQNVAGERPPCASPPRWDGLGVGVNTQPGEADLDPDVEEEEHAHDQGNGPGRGRRRSGGPRRAGGRGSVAQGPTRRSPPWAGPWRTTPPPGRRAESDQPRARAGQRADAEAEVQPLRLAPSEPPRRQISRVLPPVGRPAPAPTRTRRARRAAPGWWQWGMINRAPAMISSADPSTRWPWPRS